jgi:hypothetical protein
MHLVAARVTNRRAVIDHKLYWATAALTAEALYLCAILNSPLFTELARPFMSYGKDERDLGQAHLAIACAAFQLRRRHARSFVDLGK